MVRDYAALAPDEVRRKDRQVEDDAWIEELLRRVPMGVLATVDGAQPFTNSNLFVYDAARRVIYMHTARTGRTRANVDGAELVCFTATEMGRLLPADKALEMSVEYASVVAFGRATVLADSAEKRGALEMLLAKYFGHLRYGDDYAAITQEELDRTAVYRIDVERWTGKQKRVADDFPGAFRYGAMPLQQEG